jgi:hypothetical protein
VPLLVGAIAFGFFVPRPTVLIDAEGKLAAVSDGTTIAYLFKKPTKYVRGNWLSLWGGVEYQDGKPIKYGQWQGGDVNVACDDWACRITKGDANLSIVHDANAMVEECQWAQTIVATDKAVRPDNCKALVLTSWDLFKSGGVGLVLQADGQWQTLSFKPSVALRPWS